MSHQTDNGHFPPVLTVSDDLYNAILLADGAVVAAECAGNMRAACRTDPKLPDFFGVRRCRLTACYYGERARRTSKADAALAMRMVGG